MLSAEPWITPHLPIPSNREIRALRGQLQRRCGWIFKYCLGYLLEGREIVLRILGCSRCWHLLLS